MTVMLWTCEQKEETLFRAKNAGNGTTGKWKRGRPKRRYMYSIRENVREVGVEEYTRQADVEDHSRSGNPCK